MKKIVYKSQAIQAVILIIAACILVSLWPLRIWHETITEAILPQTGAMTDRVDNDKTILQSFVAQYDHMQTISLYLGDATEGESFYVRLLNEGQVMVAEEEVRIEPENLPGYYEVLMDVDMEVGKMYHCIVQGNDSNVFLGCESLPLEEMPYAGTMYYDNTAIEGMNLVADYNYSVPLRKGKVLLIGALTVLLAALAIAAVRGFYRKRERDCLITVERAFKFVMNPIVAAGTVFCLIAVLMGACGNYALDNTFFFISILLLSAILFYGINHNRDGQEPVITVEYLKTHAADILQSVFIAGAIAACCEYMSGLYDIHHAVAERKEMLWFALAVIAMFKWKEIFNVYNLIYVVGAGIYGYHYYQSNLTEEMSQLDVQVLKYTVWIAILLGLIVIRTVIGLFKMKLARPNLLYAGLLAVFFALIIIFRNGRWWTVALVVAFTLFYLNYGMWEHKAHFLTNLIRGAIFQFLWATGYCMLYRPYVTYRNARYTHIFHTVTITATYLTMIECMAAVLLLNKLVKSRKLKDCWKELVLFGVSSSYMMFTMSRTAFLAVGAALLFALIIMSAGMGKKKLQNFGKNLGMMALAVLVCFPVIFSMQRNIPALVSEPYLYEIEYSMYCPDDVMRGRKLGSENFMSVGRFIDVFAEKLFGIPEGTFDVYGEIEEYERTHANEASVDNHLLIASADYIPDGVGEEEKDYTNGRLDIFRSYIEQLNMTGHEEMGATLKNGEIATHAHNIYLQVAYDHGIPVGIAFLLVGIVTFVMSLWYYYKKREVVEYAALPVVVTIAVAVAGIVEWIFHLSNPCGLLLMLVITPLVFKSEN